MTTQKLLMLKHQKEFIDLVSSLVKSRFTYVNEEISDWIACLSALETGFGNSNIYQQNCNLFGMKLPKFRLSTAIGVNRNHAVYPTLVSSICDFFYWLQFVGFNQSYLKGDLDKFVTKFSKTKYNPSKDYVDTINSIYQLFKSYQNEH